MKQNQKNCWECTYKRAGIFFEKYFSKNVDFFKTMGILINVGLPGVATLNHEIKYTAVSTFPTF